MTASDLELQRARQIGHAAPPEVGLPPPPYQLRDCTFVMIGATFDRADAAALLPSELEVADEGTGGFYVYSAPLGWGIAPYTASVAWIDVKGFDSADGSHARYMVFGAYSGLAIKALGYGANLVEGDAEVFVGGERAEARANAGHIPCLQLAARLTPDPPFGINGTHYYIGPSHDGELTVTPVAFSFDFQAAEPESVEFLAPADSVLHRMTPRVLSWAGASRGGITIGAWAPLFDRPASSAAMSVASYLDLLARMSKAAVAVDIEGKVLFHNEAAQRLAGDGFTLSNGRFHIADSNDTWTSTVREALDEPSPWWERDPLVITRRNARTPLLGQLVPYQPGPSEKMLLVLLTDPGTARGNDPARALQLLGLTPAEARIAALIGDGQPPRLAATQLGNSLSTVRSTLKVVYGKLGIRRQSELARLVARLDTLGV